MTKHNLALVNMKTSAKTIAQVTLIITHDKCPTARVQRDHNTDTRDLVFDLINGDAAGWEHGVDIIDLAVSPLVVGINTEVEEDE